MLELRCDEHCVLGGAVGFFHLRKNPADPGRLPPHAGSFLIYCTSNRTPNPAIIEMPDTGTNGPARRCAMKILVLLFLFAMLSILMTTLSAAEAEGH